MLVVKGKLRSESIIHMRNHNHAASIKLAIVIGKMNNCEFVGEGQFLTMLPTIRYLYTYQAFSRHSVYHDKLLLTVTTCSIFERMVSCTIINYRIYSNERN